MANQTINDTNSSARMLVNESNNMIDIRYNSIYPSYILTTSPTMPAKESLLYVQGHGEYYCYAGSFTRRANMSSYLIMLTLSGKEILEYQGNRYTMSEGTFYWIDCMHLHYFYTLPEGQPRHAMWIHFNGPSAEFYYRQFLRLNNNSHVCKLPEGNKIMDGIKELIRLYNNSDESLEIDIAASAIIANIVVDCIQAAALQNVLIPIPKVVKACKRYISSNYHESISLDSLAEHFNVNKYHLQKQFKRYVGLSPNDFLIHTRITRAKELLRTTDNTIGQIAQEVGIPDPSNFSRLFKKHEKYSPMNYRKFWIDPTMTAFDSRSDAQ